ncbi:integral membrane protein GPR180 [Plasmodium brasilianum]|uniref:Integral membrane protein GPR180 n=1 Tax=Plasmodium brasilianum TaxID=5824 RepID=A0ACB9Y3T5_PLABR|nr:integral membrane protein GPR180 [Plasmodium brasilianum]
MTKIFKRFFIFLGFLVSIIVQNDVKGKVFHGDFNIKKNEKIHYLTKFSCSIGTCEFNIKMRLKDNIFTKLLHNYYKINSRLSNDGEDNVNSKLFNMDYDNAYYVLTNNNLQPLTQRITLMLDIEQNYVNKYEKCFAFGNLRSVHRFKIPFHFKYSDLINSKTYNIKNFINNKHSMSFTSTYSELKNNKYLQSEISNHALLINEKNENYEYKNIYAKTTHRVHVWFLMFDDCYDSFIHNLKLNIRAKLAYWEYLLKASNKKDISNLSSAELNISGSQHDISDDHDNDRRIKDYDAKYYKSNNFDKNTLLENPKRLLFLENNFTKGEVEDMSFFLKYHNFKNMKNFTNMYNNLYKNGFYEQVIDYIYENEGFKVEYEVNIFQTNNSHFSYELLHSPILTFILTILYIFLIFQYGNRIIQNIVSKEHKHAMVLCVAVVILIQLISNFLLLIHLLVYSKNGIGIELFKISFNILNFLTQIIMCTMLLSLSYGLTIFEARFNIFSRIKIIFGIITFFHVVLVILDNTYIKESSSKYFDNDNITGYIILALRVLLAIVYHVNINNLFLEAKIAPIQYFKVSDMSASDLPGGTSSWFNQKTHTY